MDALHKLSIDDSWLASEECKKLTEYAKDLLKKDDLSPCDIEVINSNPSEFWTYRMAMGRTMWTGNSSTICSQHC